MTPRKETSPVCIVCREGRFRNSMEWNRLNDSSSTRIEHSLGQFTIRKLPFSLPSSLKKLFPPITILSNSVKLSSSKTATRPKHIDPMSILFTRLYPFNCNLDGVSQMYDLSSVDRTPFSLISPNNRGNVLHIWI